MGSTTGKNRSILAGLVSSPVTDTPTTERATPTPERLSTRLSGLARVTAGDVKEKTLKLVDPARCKMWSRHNRRYDLLNEEVCRDLLESLRSQGGQEFPAIVRRLENDPDFDFEVICGARRHWAVSYLRNVEHRDIRYLIEERALDDEQAFRLADIENRAREDICDYERALDYKLAVESYYGGVAQRMADRLEVGKAWLSRFLDLAKLPEGVIGAFGDIRVLKEHHARSLKPLLASPDTKSKILAAAKRIALEQDRARSEGKELLEAAKVLTQLKKAAEGNSAATKVLSEPIVVSRSDGERLFSIKLAGEGRALFDLALDSKADNEDMVAAFRSELERLRPKV